jgi:hypothetical protein
MNEKLSDPMMAESTQKHEALIYEVQKFEKEYLSRVDQILQEAQPTADKIEDIRRKYGLTREKHFNFFTSISDLYKWENFHSDVLATILDPETREIGNIEYLKLFVDLIKAILKKDEKEIAGDMSFSEDTKVERETGRIDVFIHDNKKCIIVENKINNAPDQPDQIARYVEYAKGRGLNPVAVVYILPVGLIPKEPPVDEYSRKLLVKLPVLLPSSAGDNRDNLDLVNGWLDKIADFDNISNIGISPQELTARVYIHQYSNLLKGLECDVMAYGFEVELVKKLFRTEESIRTAAEIAEVWNKRGKLLQEVIFDELIAQGFEDHSSAENCVSKKLTDEYYLGFYKDYSFGFMTPPKGAELKQETRDKLKKILEQFDAPAGFFKGDIYDDEYWVSRPVNMDRPNIVDEVKKQFERLESVARKT